MKKQNYRIKDAAVTEKFIEWRKKNDVAKIKRLNLSWSNWGFGMESFEQSADRLAKNKVKYVELHGNLYGDDLGYRAPEMKETLKKYGLSVSGICGMVSAESEFASKSHVVRQRCVDYMKRHIDFCAAVGGKYILFCAGAVGRPQKYDDYEFDRAADTMRILGDLFVKNNIRGALEPVRSDEVSLVHTFAQAKAMLDVINHPGIQHIAGDLFHMLLGENHIGETIIQYGNLLTNLHMADTHRKALGTGMLDLDQVIMALYAVGYNNEYCYCSPEPLGGGSDPYVQMYGKPDKAMLDELVRQTAEYFYERENALLNASDDELRSL